jgi:hypothetical protein
MDLSDLVFEMQLAALQLNDFKVISRAMKESLSNFGFEGFVMTLQVDFVGLFHDMRQNRLLPNPPCAEIKVSAAIVLIYIKVSRGLRAKYNVIIY